MEGRVHVPVASERVGEPSCSVSASSETPRQGLERAIPSHPRQRPGSSRIVVASASIAPLAGRPIRVSIPSYAYVSHDWQGIVKSPFYHPLLTVQRLRLPADAHSTLFHRNLVRHRPPRPLGKASDAPFLLCLGRGQARPAFSSPPPQLPLWRAVPSV